MTAISKRRSPTNNSRTRRRRPSVELLETRQLLSTFVVTNTGDSAAVGSGSLRRAILDSNGDLAQTNLITFNIPARGGPTINVVSALPAITQSVTIDGTTEPGYSGTPLVEVNGAGAGSGTDGLQVEADDTTVQGLIIAQFSQDGIYVSASNDAIAANYIGTAPTGTSALGNGRQGVLVNGSNDTIGGSTAGSGNVIAGNGNDGLQIAGSGATGDVVQGNVIGKAAVFSAGGPNGRFGILVNFQASHNLIGTNGDGVNDFSELNLISGNSSWGIEISDPGTQDNVVAGNYIGTGVHGEGTNPNGGGGVLIQDGATANLIGTDGISSANADEVNVISGNNGAAGIMISDSGTNFNVVAGNLIGTDALGANPLGNSGDGVLIADGAQSNRIGVNAGDPGAAAEPNVIAANSFSGVSLSDPGTNFNSVSGNYIGTNPTLGSTSLGNGEDGVSIANGAQSNTIGGSTALANFIRFNAQNGVGVYNNATTGNTIRFNSIDRNIELGIDLGGGGSPNNLENCPSITSAGYGTTTTVGVSFVSLPNGSYTIDFYASPIGDGEGNRWLGSVSVTTDANGQVNPPTTFNLPANTKPDTWITATATDQAGDTSEFSNALQLLKLSSQVTVIPSTTSVTYGQSLTFTAKVAPVDSGLSPPTGTIQFQLDGLDLGPVVNLVSGAATSISTSTLPAGHHTISAVYSGDLTYTITYVNGQLTVKKAPLTITAASQTMVAGQAVPSLTASFSGFVNGDTAASLTTPPTISTPATSASPAGSYPIVASGAGSPNYTIRFVNGTLTVLPALATVQNVSITKMTVKHKTTLVIVLQFSEALYYVDAQNLKTYHLVTVPKSKKQKGKPVALAKASYNSTTFTVTLTTRKPLVLNPPIKLTVVAASLLDTLGRPLNGGTNSVATLSQTGVTVNS
ncbi:MAG: MBG domain-containing protein [Isosphaerales bacterium]